MSLNTPVHDFVSGINPYVKALSRITKKSGAGRKLAGILLPALLLSLLAIQNMAETLPLGRIKLPPGFKISIYAENVEGARSMCLSPSGVLYVGTRDEGKIYALPDYDRDYRADDVLIVADGLNMPNGVAFRDNSLYAAEINRIIKYKDLERDLKNPPEPVIISDIFPKEKHHGWKFIRFGPDGMLYVPVGAPCNVCRSAERIYAAVTRLKSDGTGFEIFAEGIRNTVGFDWHPETRELWFTDNGRDWMGNNKPPDELNRAPEKGMHFGFPYMHGKDIADPKFGKGSDYSKYAKPEAELGAHVAALGMRFYTGKMFPAEYRSQIFIAEHGSWNSTVPRGYRVSLVRLENNKAAGYEVFAEGWLKGFSAWGRPVDIEIMPDGSMLLSDDKAGVIYRIVYNPAPGER